MCKAKAAWKDLVKHLIESDNRESLLESTKKYKKLDYASLSCEEPRMREYFLELNLTGARIKFKERSSCFSQCKSHYPSQPEFLKSPFCEMCETGSIETIFHWKYTCPALRKFERNRNLREDADLISFYKDIISFKKSMEEGK